MRLGELVGALPVRLSGVAAFWLLFVVVASLLVGATTCNIAQRGELDADLAEEEDPGE